MAARWLSQLKGQERAAVFGFLLGHHLESLLSELEPGFRLLIFEARPALFKAALARRDLSELLSDSRVEIFLGPFSAPAANLTPATHILRPPAVARLLAGDYEALEKPPGSKPIAGGKPLRRIIFFDFGYYLNREVPEALEGRGLQVARWRPESGTEIRESDFRRLLALIKNFRPQLVLTINHFGFDEAGLMAATLARLRLPAVSWFVDSPGLILRAAALQMGGWISVFTWDSDYLPLLKSLGAENVYFLPLAASTAYFQPRPVEISRPWLFVGDSLERATDKYLARLGLGRAQLPVIDRVAHSFRLIPDLSPARLIRQSNLPAALNLPARAPAVLTDLEALITWRASAEARSEILGALAAGGPGRLTIAGDGGWRRRLFEMKFQLCPEVDYYRELSGFYQSAAVNVNITSAQMKNGLNQRVFDVPASGAFLLTDYREQLAEMFDLEREVVCYRGREEALDKARWYERHQPTREKVINRARARVLRQHTYHVRLEKLLTRAAADHGLKWPV